MANFGRCEDKADQLKQKEFFKSEIIPSVSPSDKDVKDNKVLKSDVPEGSCKWRKQNNRKKTLGRKWYLGRKTRR